MTIRTWTPAMAGMVFGGLLAAVPAGASSHREALTVLNEPCADNTDTYAWVSPTIREVLGWTAALQSAIEWLKPGDLALIQADTIDLGVNTMRDYLAGHPTTREVTLSEALATAAPAESSRPRVAETAELHVAHANEVPVAP